MTKYKYYNEYYSNGELKCKVREKIDSLDNLTDRQLKTLEKIKDYAINGFYRYNASHATWYSFSFVRNNHDFEGAWCYWSEDLKGHNLINLNTGEITFNNQNENMLEFKREQEGRYQNV